MIKTCTAEAVLPDIAYKPAELIGWFTVIDTTLGLGETTDLVHYSGWIEKGMKVVVINGNCLVQACYDRMTRPTQNSLLFTVVEFFKGITIWFTRLIRLLFPVE